MRAFFASPSCKLEVKEDLDTEKKINKNSIPQKRYLDLTVCKLGALQRQEDLQAAFVKTGDLLNLKVFLWNS